MQYDQKRTVPTVRFSFVNKYFAIDWHEVLYYFVKSLCFCADAKWYFNKGGILAE